MCAQGRGADQGQGQQIQNAKPDQGGGRPYQWDIQIGPHHQRKRQFAAAHGQQIVEQIVVEGELQAAGVTAAGFGREVVVDSQCAQGIAEIDHDNGSGQGVKADAAPRLQQSPPADEMPDGQQQCAEQNDADDKAQAVSANIP